MFTVFSPCPPKGIFQERLLNYKRLFCPRNSQHNKWELFPLKDCLMFKPQDNFYFKYLLCFSHEFNLPFNLFKGFDHAAKRSWSFSLVNIRAQNSSFKFLQCAFPLIWFWSHCISIIYNFVSLRATWRGEAEVSPWSRRHTRGTLKAIIRRKTTAQIFYLVLMSRTNSPKVNEGQTSEGLGIRKRGLWSVAWLRACRAKGLFKRITCIYFYVS